MRRTLPAVLFLTVLVLLPLLALHSSTVARRLGEAVAARSGIALSFGSGSLLGGFELEQLSWVSEGVTVDVAGLAVEPRWEWESALWPGV